MIDDVQSLDEESSLYVSVDSFHCFTPYVVYDFSTTDINKVKWVRRNDRVTIKAERISKIIGIVLINYISPEVSLLSL